MSQRTAQNASAQARRRRATQAPGGPSAGGAMRREITLADAPKPSFGTWLRYRFDLTIGRGSGALIAWLMLVTAIFVIATGIVLLLVARHDGIESTGSAPEAIWDSLMRVLDPGTVTGDDAAAFRAASLFITLGGIFIFSTLIGLIASVIDRTIESLRKGRGIVVEQDHTLVLGWSEKLHVLLSELEVANANRTSGACVVVLADRDRVDMEDEINARFGGSIALEVMTGQAAIGMLRGLTRRSTGRTRIVCRSGDPANPSDLAIASPTTARSIVVLSEEREDPDAQAAKIMLSLMSFDRDLASMDVTMELHAPENAAPLADAAGGRLRTVVSTDLVASVTAQVCRQGGLGAIYQDLLDFAGDEIYFANEPRLVGTAFGQALLSYPECSPIGLRGTDGTIRLNPPMNHVIEAGERLIMVAADDDRLVLGDIDAWRTSRSAPDREPTLEPDHLLLVGWNDLSPRMLAHLAGAVAPGSTIDIVVPPGEAESLRSGLVVPDESRLEVRMLEADTTRLEPLRELLDGRDYERMVLLGARGVSASQADARTLLSLVHARRILTREHRNAGTSVVAELLDARSVQLGRVANPDDFVVSQQLTSLLLAQMSENGELAEVFRELLDGTGAEIVMHPIQRYLSGSDVEVAAGEMVEWRVVVEQARELGECALALHAMGEGAGVRLNPAKSERVPAGAHVQVAVVR